MVIKATVPNLYIFYEEYALREKSRGDRRAGKNSLCSVGFCFSFEWIFYLSGCDSCFDKIIGGIHWKIN
jgi:hypothetical protein